MFRRTGRSGGRGEVGAATIRLLRSQPRQKPPCDTCGAQLEGSTPSDVRWSMAPGTMPRYGRASGGRAGSPGVLLQERQRLLVKCGNVLVEGSVRAVLEDVELRILDAVLQRGASAKRVEVTMSWRPKVICVGARILPSWASASWAITASDS